MKKLLFFMTLTVGLSIFQSCSKDADLEFSKSNIVGKWYCTVQQYKDGGSIIHTEKYNDESKCLRLSSDGSGEFIITSGELFEMTSSGPKAFGWSISNNQLITDFHGYQEYDILSLTNDNLELEMRFSNNASIVAKFKKEKSSINYDSKLSQSSLKGRWAVLKSDDFNYGEIYNYTYADEQLETGEYIGHYVDFYEDGTGYKCSPSSSIFLGGSSTSFTWTLKKNTILTVNKYREEKWEVESYDGQFMTLVSHWDRVWLQKTGKEFK